ncbi:Flagellar motor protein MotB [Nitrospira sp. KM1]|uniref:flagellar motor protein MotB n=1 Tax=Nitrospira sp. KM1 TaxID=1936990 RepID=UPI0013A74419|nr:flagellar motor protein MotB [Nitrospira sp. KM1]BCA54753.1 Flagellar motor protein MotB [Nitrospira sp. KM1]
MAKHKHEEHENHERWLVSYADFITLLFAFFVVMYSVSSVNEGKYRTVSESIKAALNPVVSAPTSKLAFTIGTAKPTTMHAPVDAKEPVIRRLRAIMKSLKETTGLELIEMIEHASGDLIITVPDHVMFNSGEASLRHEALPFLKALSDVLIELDRQVRIEGHTDNVPIRTAQYPSNWELSAVRAVMVVRVMAELNGVPANRLSAVGRADSVPRTDNLTPESRAKNRRVEIVLLAEKTALPQAHDALGREDAANAPSFLDDAAGADVDTPAPPVVQ